MPRHISPPPKPPTDFDLLFGRPGWEEDGNQGWGNSWGDCMANTRPSRSLPPQGARRSEAPAEALPAPAPVGMYIPALITSIFKAQAEAQLAQSNANHANLLAFQTATAQALAAKSGDKESKLTAAKRRILQACAGTTHATEFQVEHMYRDINVEVGLSDELGWILRQRLKPIPHSPHKNNLHITPQLIATVKTFSFSSNGDNTYVGCTKGMTIFTVPWRTTDAINKDLAQDKYVAAATLKSVVDIRKHATSTKVKLLTSLLGLVWVLNNYCHLLDVLFSPNAPIWGTSSPYGMHWRPTRLI